MQDINEQKLIQEEEAWEKNKPLLERQKNLRAEKESFYRNKISTTKLLVLFLFINCSLIEIFTGYVILKSFKIVELTLSAPDFTPLIALIGAVVGEVVGFAIYALKSLKENTSGGIVFEQAMLKQENPMIIPEEENDEEEAVG